MQVILTEQEYEQLKAMAMPQAEIEDLATKMSEDYVNRLLATLVKSLPTARLLPEEGLAIKQAIQSVKIKP